MEEGPKATKSWGTVGGGGRGRESHSKTPHQHALGLKRLSAKKGEPPPWPPPPQLVPYAGRPHCATRHLEEELTAMG